MVKPYKIDDYKTAYFKLEKNYDILVAKYGRANTENVKLKKEVEELNKFIEETAEVVQELDKECKELSKTYKKLEVKYVKLKKAYTAIILDCEQLIKESDAKEFKGMSNNGPAVYDK